LVENWNRYYEPQVGKYLQPEPMMARAPGYFGYVARRYGTQPNPYGYAYGNPIGYVDGDGKFPGFFGDFGQPNGMTGLGLANVGIAWLNGADVGLQTGWGSLGPLTWPVINVVAWNDPREGFFHADTQGHTTCFGSGANQNASIYNQNTLVGHEFQHTVMSDVWGPMLDPVATLLNRIWDVF
jgi:hypothetical protein